MQDRKGVFIIDSPDVVNWEVNWEVKWEKTPKVGKINQKVGKFDLILNFQQKLTLNRKQMLKTGRKSANSLDFLPVSCYNN